MMRWHARLLCTRGDRQIWIHTPYFPLNIYAVLPVLTSSLIPFLTRYLQLSYHLSAKRYLNVCPNPG